MPNKKCLKKNKLKGKDKDKGKCKCKGKGKGLSEYAKKESNGMHVAGCGFCKHFGETARVLKESACFRCPFYRFDEILFHLERIDQAIAWEHRHKYVAFSASNC